MTDEWIWYWFRCFKLNNDYKRYCEAKRNKDSKALALLERKFKRISELYADWGDIHAFSERAANRKHWKAWLEEHRHLFVNEDSRKAVVIRTTPKKLDQQYLYLKVPIRKSAPMAINEAKELIRKEYSKAKIKAAAKTGVVKYPLAVKIISDRTLKGVRKALNVWHLYNPAIGRDRTAKEVALILAEGKRGKKAKGVADWTWTLENFNYGDLDDMRVQVMKYNRNAKNIIANTIKGRFPVK